MSKKIPWVSMENVDTSKDGFIFFCKCCGVKYQVSYGFIQRYTPPKVVVFVDYSHPLVGLMGNDVALTYNVEFSGGAPLYGAASAGTQG